jgi:hypothetical protein
MWGLLFRAGQKGPLPFGSGLRLHDGVQLDDLLLDLSRDVRDDVLVEEAVVLLLRLPDLSHAGSLGVLKRDVEHEARLLLHQRDERRRDLVVVRQSEPINSVSDQDRQTIPLRWIPKLGPLHIRVPRCQAQRTYERV